MNSAKVGQTIKTLRLQAGYTQHELASYIGVTDQAVSKWERGQSVPDISIVTKLSVLLNIDVDNLLAGNISYIEKTWQGLLIFKENSEIFSGTELYGKPLVYLLLCYFMLAGIRDIFISCPKKDKVYIQSLLGDGKKLGVNLNLLEEGTFIPPLRGNTMVVYNNPFLYGPNLTKYFQRAMSRLNGVSALTVDKTIGGSEISVSYDNYRVIQSLGAKDGRQFCTPVLFFPAKYFDQISNIQNFEKIEPLYAEPMGNGMIEYSITDRETALDTAIFVRYIKCRMGKDIYDPEEIAMKRNFNLNS